MRRCIPLALHLLPLLVVAACGGGGPAEEPVAPAPAPETAGEDTADAQAAPASPQDAARAAAAGATAASDSNACATIRPFYWEIGDVSSRLASGSTGAAAQRIGGQTPLSIASASKWLYASYVVQKRAGALTEGDRSFLTMRSGYISLGTCDGASSVDACLSLRGNGAHTAAADGKFDYDGGHFEKHASLNGLGTLGNAALAAELRTQLGSDVALAFSQPLLAGGVVMSADAYARVLRKMLDGRLAIGARLGAGAVCTNPTTCASGQALYAPVPSNESWHYATGHWVEDDPAVGDGAFSSPGAFGFYPWIDAGKRYYGIVARTAVGGAFTSVRCGRLIRKAWLTGVAQ